MSTLEQVIQTGTAANLPTEGIPGRLYFTTDTMQVFRDSGTAWVNVTPAGSGGSGSGLTNPMTTAGDLIVGGTSGQPTRLAAGASGSLLSVVSGTPGYIAHGDIITHNAAEFQTAGALTAPVTINTGSGSTVGLIVKSAGTTSGATIVQSGSAFGSLSTSTLSVTFAHPVTAGNTLIAVGGFFNRNASNYCADSAGNSYSQPFIDSSGGYYSVNYCQNVPACSPTITMHSDGGDVQTLYCFEVSGIGAFQAATLNTGSFGNGGGTMVIPNTTVSAATLAFTFGLVTYGTISHANTSLAIVPASSQPFTTQGVWAGNLAAGTYGDSIISSGTTNQTFNVGMMVFFAATGGNSVYNTVPLQEWQSSAGTVLSGVNGRGQIIMATTSGIPTTTATAGATAYDPSTGILYGYESSGWAPVAGSVGSGAGNLVLATPNGSSGTASLRALVAADIPALPYDTTGAAANALTWAEMYSANASNLSSGTVAPARLPVATTSTFGVVEPDGSTITISGGVISAATQSPTSAVGGDLSGNLPNPTVVKINGVAPGNIVSHNVSEFDAAGAAATALTSAETFSANASNLTSGTVAVARLPVATTSALGVVKPDGSTITISSGVITAVAAAPSGTVGGDLSGSLPNPTVAKIGGVTPGNIVSHNAADFDAAGAASTAIATALLKANNLSDLASASTARTNLGLGTAATQASTAFDAAGAAASAITTAEAFSANASNLSSGTVPVAQLPVATTSALGVVKPDGSTITITSGGVVSAAPTALPSGSAGQVVATPASASGSASLRALVASDIPALSYDASGAAAAATATALQKSNNLSDLASASTARTNLGLGTAATQASSAFDAAGAAASAITTAEAFSANASNLTSGTVAVARLPVATTSALGVVEPDGSTITISSGVISAVAAAVPSGSAGKVYATPASSTGSASLRALVASDIPALSYDASGAAASALTSAEAYSANASNLSSGTVPVAQLPLATTSAAGIVKPDGTTVTISSGVISAVSTGGYSGSAGQVVATPASSTGAASLRALVASDIPTLGYLLPANNLSDVASLATTRTNLGLGSAAFQSSTAFDAAGAASTALTTAEAYSANASNLSSGTVPVARLPVATTSTLGVVEPDGSTITISSGVISASVAAPVTLTGPAAGTTVPLTIVGTVAPAFVQAVHAAAQTATITNTQGNAMVVVVGVSNYNTVVPTPTDSLGNTYTLAASINTTCVIYVWIALNIKGGSNTVTTVQPGTAGLWDVSLVEYQGVYSASALDGATANVSTGAGTLTLSITTANPNDLLFTAGYSGNSLSTPTGYTQRQNLAVGSGGYTNLGDQVVATAGSKSAVWTTAAGQGAYALIALKGNTAQTADLLDFDSAGTVLSRVNSSGQFVLPSTAGLPSNSPTAGAIAYNSTSKTLSLYSGSAWSSVAPTATTSTLGLVEPDGTTITIASGVITASRTGIGAAASGANADITSMSALTTISHALTCSSTLAVNNTTTITGAASTPTYVQGAINSANSTLSTTFSSANTAGNAIVVFMFCGISATQTVPTDSLGNTYTLVSSTTNGTLCLFVYVALNILGGTNTVTVHNSSGVSHTIVLMHEYSNVALVSALDSQAVANATSANSGQTLTVSTTTINPSDLLLTSVFCVPGATPNEAAPSGYSLRTYINSGTGGCWAGAADQNVSSAGSYSASWITQGAAGNGYCLSLVALKALPASALTVSGSTTLNSTLAVTGATTLTGATSVGSTLAVTGAATLSSTLAVTGDTSLGVHINGSSTTAPTIATGSGAGNSPTGVSVTGNDMRGQVAVTTGSSPVAAAQIALITFRTAYTNAPVVVISPGNAATAALGTAGAWSNTNTGQFAINSGTNALAASTAYLWNWIAIG